jgi:phosphoribosylformylglycinamidine cyclo-ligase
MASSPYSGAGVKAMEEIPGFKALLQALAPTFGYAGEAARPVIDFGYYANVIPITPDLGVAISTDGVGTKILVAQSLGKYDTVGIDCVAMNANDIVCVGARPLAMVDYLAIETADDYLLAELGKGLARGAELAGISIPGGELAQVRDLIRGEHPGTGFDLVGTCIGTVGLDSVLTGRDIEPGDAVIGLASSGVHSNGLTLARRVLPDLEEEIPELGRSAGTELLEPTMIYVSAALAVLETGIRPSAFAHITGDGFLNLLRVEANVSFVLDALPEPPAIFEVIRRRGEISSGEMYRVFNMGVGFVMVVRRDDADRTIDLVSKRGYTATVIGEAVAGPEKRITLPRQHLVGQGSAFAVLRTLRP